jgi:cation diffusion facilitator CzcD-associated flavoprotein CzcO
VEKNTRIVIGAGPYGLSIAAHLLAQGIPTQVFGKPMEFWEKMPARMYLKSVWSASTLFDPEGHYSLDRYCQVRGIGRREPIPLSFFVEYGQWFQQQAVPDVDETYVRLLERDGNGFRLELADGRSLKTHSVVLATGIAPFYHVPDFARDLPASLVAHTHVETDYTPFQGKRVVVVGSGQSALETSALLNETGAQVELIARGPVIWINRKLYDSTGPLKHIFYPPSDVGPPGLNWLVSFPLLFRKFPDTARQVMDRRAVRPAGAQWLRPRIENCVRVTERTQVVRAEVRGETLRLYLSDRTEREIDFLFLGTGYRPDIRKVDYLSPELRAQIQTRNGYPILNQWFETSVPGLHVAGALANHTFGPICRFVAGAKVPAQQIARYARAEG